MADRGRSRSETGARALHSEWCLISIVSWSGRWMSFICLLALSAQEISSLANPPTDPVTPDFNGDGMIDLADFQILADNFNTEGPHENGDLTFDGIIDLADFVKFRTAFASGQPQLAAVPEPSGGLLMKMSALAALNLLGRRRM